MTTLKPPTLVFLTSAARPRYREDALRAITLPTGTRLRFRYEVDLMSSLVAEKFRAGKYANAEILISHLDRHPTGGGEFRIVPCRIGRLVHCSQVGDFFVLDFELGEFATTSDWQSLRLECAAESPARKGEDGQPTGHFVFELPMGLPALVERSTDISLWQDVVRRLQSCHAFAEVDFFYYLHGIEDDAHVALAPKDGLYELQSGKNYQVRLTHFRHAPSPQMDETVRWLAVSSSSSPVLTTMPSNGLVIDSPYDEKRIYVQTAAVAHSTNCEIVLYRAQSPTRFFTAKVAITHVNLEFIVMAPKDTKLRDGLIIGMLLSVANLATIFANDKNWNSPVAWMLVVLAVLASVLTGIIASYKLKKP